MSVWAAAEKFALRLSQAAACTLLITGVTYLVYWLLSFIGGQFGDPLDGLIISKPALEKEYLEGLVSNLNGLFEISQWSILGIYILLAFFIEKKDVISNKSEPVIISLVFCLSISTIASIYTAVLYRANLARQIDFSKINLENLDEILNWHLFFLLYVALSALFMMLYINIFCRSEGGGRA